MIDRYVVQFDALEDDYLRERASDIKDLGNRILDNLLDQKNDEQVLPDKFVLVAENASASMLAQYQDKGLIGIVSLSGSNNSHAAILARALNLPAIMGVEHQIIHQLDRCNAIIDGYSSTLYVSPNDALLHEYQHIISEEQQLLGQIMQEADLPAITKDGHKIELLINAGLSSGFEHSQHVGACGIGLYRTEIPFMTRHCFPSEKAQTDLYRQVLLSFAQQPVVMRTLDIGGDKTLPYFPIVEDNPFLGWRGIRITLDHPELFLLQVRAMMTANFGLNNLAIMLPMISSISELDEALRLINQAHFELSSELESSNGAALQRPQIGVMIEVPGIIFQLEELAQKVDFFSVGSNDLTQYLLAVDRNNTRVANLYDFYHPAVLRALAFIAKESNKYHVPLSLCGELAHEPAGALLLIAMGYDKLSMNSHSIAKIKWAIRHVSQQQIRAILSKVLTLNTTKNVRSYLNEQLDILGLGAFIHPGK
jgi:phosphotransferase system enzyme I (PtsP)